MKEESGKAQMVSVGTSFEHTGQQAVSAALFQYLRGLGKAGGACYFRAAGLKPGVCVDGTCQQGPSHTTCRRGWRMHVMTISAHFGHAAVLL